MTDDSEADAAYLSLVEQKAGGEAFKTSWTDVPLAGATLPVDLNQDSRLLKFETLGAAAALRSETLAAARNLT